MKLEGVTAAVTGGASGLGAAPAAALAGRGAKVFVLDLPGAGDRVDPERATFVECDVTQEAQVEAAIAQAAAGGELRVCVNCAGVGTPGSRVRPVQSADVQRPQCAWRACRRRQQPMPRQSRRCSGCIPRSRG